MSNLGHVDSGASVLFSIVFNPLEEKDYKCEIPIEMNGKLRDSILITAQGYDPRQTTLPPTKTWAEIEVNSRIDSQEGFTASMPGMLKLSSQIISFGQMQPQVRAICKELTIGDVCL